MSDERIGDPKDGSGLGRRAFIQRMAVAGFVVPAIVTLTDATAGAAHASPMDPPPPTRINIRWHYSANGSAGGWSATTGFTFPGPVSMGPQAMEGNLRVAPGATLKVGYDFTIPGDNNPVSVTFTNPEVTFNVKCASGATSTLTVPMPTQTYISTNGGNWYPSGDQSSPLVYQGSIIVPDICGGGDVSFQHGGTFTATISPPTTTPPPFSSPPPSSSPQPTTTTTESPPV
jgi:hypothetical protein